MTVVPAVVVPVTKRCKKVKTGCRYIDDYLNDIRSGAIPASKEMRLACDLIERKLCRPGVTVDVELIEKGKELIERYFDMTLLPWELLDLALTFCYEPDGTLVFTEHLIMMGRGDGKNGYISGLSWFLTTKYHGIQGYNVDIIANSEEQSKVSFMDIYDMLENTWAKSKKFFTKTLEVITNTDTHSYIKYNTSGAKTKDGKRSACLIFDEIHEYEDGKVMRTFKSGFGKRPNSRVYYITTNGYVRDGILDDKLGIARQVLAGEIPKSRMVPLLYKMDSEKEVKRPELWVKACPSLPYFDTLKIEMDQEAIDMETDKQTELDFYTKRMNLPRSDMEIAVTEWDNIAATNRTRPAENEMEGWQCTVGIDYASMRDWASVDFHFKNGEERIDISHSWLCLKNPDLSRVKAPWRDWADAGHITLVDDVQISPEMLTDYIALMGQSYFIRQIILDNFRYALMKNALSKIGFTPEAKNLRLLRPSDIMRVQPIVDSCFNRHLYIWDDCPPLRWATNNTKLVRAGKSAGTDTGNFYYAKIEGKSRKTDPFMALVAAQTGEDIIQPPLPQDAPALGIIIG
jgi:phage terminase large subunit-like protein